MEVIEEDSMGEGVLDKVKGAIDKFRHPTKKIPKIKGRKDKTHKYHLGNRRDRYHSKPEKIVSKKVQKNEQNLDKIKVPANINRFMGKFITAVQSGKLDRNRQKAILYKVVKGLGISPREFQTYVQKVKQGL